VETKATSCNPTLYIDILETTTEVDEVLCNNYIPTNLHLIQGIHHGTRSTNIWIYYMYQSKHTRQKSLQKYMKFWKSRLARLNDMFDSYIKENFKVVDYHVKTPSKREHNLTWRPYGYYK
jgi:hypothetical protein